MLVAAIMGLVVVTCVAGYYLTLPEPINTYSKHDLKLEYPPGYTIEKEWGYPASSTERDEANKTFGVVVFTDEENKIIVSWWTNKEHQYVIAMEFAKAVFGEDFEGWQPAEARRETFQVLWHGHERLQGSMVTTWEEKELYMTHSSWFCGKHGGRFIRLATVTTKEDLDIEIFDSIIDAFECHETTEEEQPPDEEEQGPVEEEEGPALTVELICDITAMEIGKEYSATIIFNSTRYEGEVWLAPVEYSGVSEEELSLHFSTPAFKKHNITSGESLSFPATISWSGSLVNDTGVSITIRSQPDLRIRDHVIITLLGQGKPKAFILFLETVDPEKENHVGLTIYDKEGGHIAQDLRYRVTSFNKTFIIDPPVPGGPGWGLEAGCEFEIHLVEYQCDLVVRLINPKAQEVLNTVLSESGAVVAYEITEEDLN